MKDINSRTFNRDYEFKTFSGWLGSASPLHTATNIQVINSVIGHCGRCKSYIIFPYVLLIDIRLQILHQLLAGTIPTTSKQLHENLLLKKEEAQICCSLSMQQRDEQHKANKVNVNNILKGNDKSLQKDSFITFFTHSLLLSVNNLIER